MFDLKITNHEKAALQVIIGHMNPDEHWSCYAAIPTLAKEAGVCERVVWIAIKTTGKYIQTRSARRPGWKVFRQSRDSSGLAKSEASSSNRYPN
jgi:hypothetical protein